MWKYLERFRGSQITLKWFSSLPFLPVTRYHFMHVFRPPILYLSCMGSSGWCKAQMVGEIKLWKKFFFLQAIEPQMHVSPCQIGVKWQDPHIKGSSSSPVPMLFPLSNISCHRSTFQLFPLLKALAYSISPYKTEQHLACCQGNFHLHARES